MQACAHFHGTTHSLSLPVLWFYELLCVTAHLAKFVCANLQKQVCSYYHYIPAIILMCFKRYRLHDIQQ